MIFFDPKEIKLKYILEKDVPIEGEEYELPDEESTNDATVDTSSEDDDYTLPEDSDDTEELPEDNEVSEDDLDDDEGYDLPDENEPVSDEESIDDDSSDEGEKIPDELITKEQDLFKDINADAIKIRNKELLENYIELYKLVASLPSRIENIPKTEKSISSINFLGDKIEEVRSLIFNYIEKDFSIKTYIENINQYYKFIGVMSQIDDGISKIIV